MSTTAGLWRAAGCVTFCAVALLVPKLAAAAEWNIDPVRVELSPEQQTAAIIVRNDSDQPSSMQIQAVVWSQVDGKDVYTPTRELLVSPPVVTIPPKSDQVIRVALRRHADANRELTYRINLQELPVQPGPESTSVNVALRIGLPVFVQSQKGEAKPKMAWTVSRMPDSTLKVGVQNQGNAHVQVSDFALYAVGSDQAITGEAGSRYVLAGQSQEWLLKTSPSTKISDGRLRLKAYTDADTVDTDLVLGRP
ncbi:MAG: fimbria/pilus periplasmic chaperone [Proteobacteria bacterium]|nr:fimbria/pilus periplasmic chaperone [Pseudomonadota bacterium]